MEETQNTKRRGRGPGVNPAMVHVSLRLPKYLVDAYDATSQRSKLMRLALERYITPEPDDT